MVPQAEPSPPVAKYPFRIEHIFFARVHFERADTLPEEGVRLPLVAEIAFGLHEDPKTLTVNLRVRSAGEAEQPVKVEVVAIGMVVYTGEGAPNDASVVEFVNDHLLAVMNSRVIQVIGSFTAQMGMPPIWLPMPSAYGLDVDRFKALLDELRQAKPAAS